MTPAQVAAKLQHFNDWRRGHHDDTAQPDPREIGEAIDAAVEMIESAEEDRALCDKLADILTRTANVLKGAPRPRSRHSWHDLPDVAQRIVAARAGGQAMTLSDEQIQDLLRVGNPTDEECRLIRMGWDAAIAEIRAQPVGWIDAGDLRALEYGDSVWLNPDDEGQMVPVYLAALEAKP